MSLYSDTEFMLRRSGESALKINLTLKQFKKRIKAHGEQAIYQGLSERVKYNLCATRILQRDFRDYDGWQNRDEWSQAMRYGISTIPFWDGSPVDKLVVIGEQGIGDEVLFASVIPEALVRCKEVTYCCDERLVMPLARSLPGLNTKTRYVDARDDLIGGYSAYIPAADLLPLFRRDVTHFPRRPFIKPDPARVAEFEEYRGRIGVSWSGRHGYIDPMALGIENPLSLQYDDDHPEIETPDINLRDDIEGVLALCSVLDKVVSVPTSVWHFAAAVGTKTEVIIAPQSSEAEVDGVVDLLDWHVPVGKSVWYGKSFVYANIDEWKRK